MENTPTGLASTPHAATAAVPTAAAGCARARTGTVSPTTVRHLRVGTTQRSYRVHIPRGYTGRSPMPLIVAFHGHAESGARMQQYSGLSRLPAIVVYPDGLTGTDGTSSWQGAPYASPAADDVAFTTALLKNLRSTLCVDRGRTYAVGRSNGGGLVALLSCRMTREFAAYGVVNGALYTGTWRGCDGAAPASIVDIHGTADPVIAYRGGVRFGSRYTAIPSALRTWANRDRCVPTAVTTKVNPVVTRYDWPVCADLGHEVTHYRITGGNHVWPGAPGLRGPSATISATSLIWQFFGGHRR